MTDKLSPINIWNKHRYDDDENNDSMEEHREQRSFSVDKTDDQPQREPVQVLPSDIGAFLLHHEQDSNIKYGTEDMVSRKSDYKKDNDHLGYDAQVEAVRENDTSFTDKSEYTCPISKHLLSQEGLHRGNIATLPSAGTARRESIVQRANDPDVTATTSSDTSMMGRATAAVAAVAGLGISDELKQKSELNNSEMPSTWPDSPNVCQTDNAEPAIHGQEACYETKDQLCDNAITDSDEHSFCDRIQEPSLCGQQPSSFDPAKNQVGGAIESNNTVKTGVLSGSLGNLFGNRPTYSDKSDLSTNTLTDKDISSASNTNSQKFNSFGKKAGVLAGAGIGASLGGFLSRKNKISDTKSFAPQVLSDTYDNMDQTEQSNVDFNPAQDGVITLMEKSTPGTPLDDASATGSLGELPPTWGDQVVPVAPSHQDSVMDAPIVLADTNNSNSHVMNAVDDKQLGVVETGFKNPSTHDSVVKNGGEDSTFDSQNDWPTNEENALYPQVGQFANRNAMMADDRDDNSSSIDDIDNYRHGNGVANENSALNSQGRQLGTQDNTLNPRGDRDSHPVAAILTGTGIGAALGSATMMQKNQPGTKDDYVYPVSATENTDSYPVASFNDNNADAQDKPATFNNQSHNNYEQAYFATTANEDSNVNAQDKDALLTSSDAQDKPIDSSNQLDNSQLHSTNANTLNSEDINPLTSTENNDTAALSPQASQKINTSSTRDLQDSFNKKDDSHAVAGLLAGGGIGAAIGSFIDRKHNNKTSKVSHPTLQQVPVVEKAFGGSNAFGGASAFGKPDNVFVSNAVTGDAIVGEKNVPNNKAYANDYPATTPSTAAAELKPASKVNDTVGVDQTENKPLDTNQSWINNEIEQGPAIQPQNWPNKSTNPVDNRHEVEKAFAAGGIAANMKDKKGSSNQHSENMNQVTTDTPLDENELHDQSRRRSSLTENIKNIFKKKDSTASAEPKMNFTKKSNSFGVLTKDENDRISTDHHRRWSTTTETTAEHHIEKRLAVGGIMGATANMEGRRVLNKLYPENMHPDYNEPIRSRLGEDEITDQPRRRSSLSETMVHMFKKNKENDDITNDTIHENAVPEFRPTLSNAHPSTVTGSAASVGKGKSESISSTRATTGQIIPDTRDNEGKNPPVTTPLVGPPNVMNSTEYQITDNRIANKKDGIAGDLKAKVTKAVRRLSTRDSGGSLDKGDITVRRLSDAEAFKNITLGQENAFGNNPHAALGKKISPPVATTISTNNKPSVQSHDDSVPINNSEVFNGTKRRASNSDSDHLRYTGVCKEYARISGVHTLKPAGTVTINNNTSNFIKQEEPEVTKKSFRSGLMEKRVGSFQKTIGRLFRNRHLQDNGELKEISGRRKVNAYNSANNLS